MPKRVMERYRYSTPWFLLREIFGAFFRHKGLNISASLSFYAMLALIPMALLMFFLLSHMVTSSSYAVVKLAMLTSNLVPELSQYIMVEVYNISAHRAVWGIFGVFALFWAVTPLARALRASFHTISAVIEAPSFLHRAFKDAIAVMSILLLLFLFTFSGLMLEKLWSFLNPGFVSAPLVNSVSSMLLSTLMLITFYRAFFPVKVLFRHILAGSLFTAALWIAMRPSLNLVLLVNQSYGTIFGGMKNIFISILWVYYSFAVFLLGTELISALHKKNVLLLKNLFSDAPCQPGYVEMLSDRFGRPYRQGDFIFREGEEGHEMYYVVTGVVHILHDGRLLREVTSDEYFGEMAVLSGETRTADAIVQSAHAEVLHISADSIETLLQEEPAIAMSFLRRMASRLQQPGGLPERRPN